MQHTKILRGKYQITKNTYVVCYLHIVEANKTEIRTLIKLKSSGFAMVPVGTTIFFNVEPLIQDSQQSSRSYSIFSIKVNQVEDLDGHSLHVCTSIDKKIRGDLRTAERRVLDFPLRLSTSQAMFTAIEGNNQGLTLQYTANNAMVSLALERTYEFSVNLKEKDYVLPGCIKHIQYDWQTHQHVIGVHFNNLNKDQDMILNLLVDPDYVIPISNKASVDTSTGKISVDG
jgi:hypothetical protein